MARTLNHTVTAAGEELAKGNIALSGSNTPLSGDLSFTIAEPATVKYRVTNEGAGSEKPVISWLAIAALADKSGLQAAVNDAAALQAEHYTGASWAPFAAALESAQTVLADANAGQTAVDAALQGLSAARTGLVDVMPVTLSVQRTCVGKKVMLTATAGSNGELRISLTLKTPFGTKSFNNMAPGKSRFHPFNTGSSSVADGTVEAMVTATVDGRTVSQQRTLSYLAHFC